jgi:hypothetical protein
MLFGLVDVRIHLLVLVGMSEGCAVDERRRFRWETNIVRMPNCRKFLDDSIEVCIFSNLGVSGDWFCLRVYIPTILSPKKTRIVNVFGIPILWKSHSFNILRLSGSSFIEDMILSQYRNPRHNFTCWPRPLSIDWHGTNSSRSIMYLQSNKFTHDSTGLRKLSVLEPHWKRWPLFTLTPQ